MRFLENVVRGAVTSALVVVFGTSAARAVMTEEEEGGQTSCIQLDQQTFCPVAAPVVDTECVLIGDQWYCH
jgi:hypothetical protein